LIIESKHLPKYLSALKIGIITEISTSALINHTT
jgi:hypothetical protein